jgi:hypothetical protein
MRAESRDNLRATVFRCSTPLSAPLCSSGCATAKAARAYPLSRAAMAVSTFLTKVRMRLKRERLTAVRRAVWRMRFSAET